MNDLGTWDCRPLQLGSRIMHKVVMGERRLYFGLLCIP
jgi:hypothetical protein